MDSTALEGAAKAHTYQAEYFQPAPDGHMFARQIANLTQSMRVRNRRPEVRDLELIGRAYRGRPRTGLGDR